MLILKTLSVQTMHGYGIAKHLQRLSIDVIQVEEGSLYPAFQRMRQKGWIKAEWGQTPNNQRARYYSITPLGRKQLITVVGLAATHVARADAKLLYEDRTPKPTPEEIEMRRLERIYRAAATPKTRPDRDMRRTLRRLKRGE
jgi:transcriptional regulator